MSILWLRRQRRNLIVSFSRKIAGVGAIEQALSDRYFVSIRENGVAIQLQIAGASKTEIETEWPSGITPKALLGYLKNYRTAPEKAKPDAAIRDALRQFLFCGGQLDAPLKELLDPGTELFIAGDTDAMPLLFNVPWELADGIPTIAADQRLEGTLATLPMARVAPDVVSTTIFEQERLHLTYCISEPSGVTKIGGKEFDDWLKLLLPIRSGMLDYTPIVGPALNPRLADVKSAIDAKPPHIFVLFGHGKTAGGKPQVLLDQWVAVEDIAAELAKHRKTFLVLLIACDLTFLDEGATAQSGSLAFLKAGIPAAVAMQGKVLAQRGADFIKTTIDHLVGGPPLAAAIAEGRMSMAPSDAAELVDWSFPALFHSADGAEKTRGLDEYFRFRPALEALLRSIPRNEQFAPRPRFENAIGGFLAAGGAGVRLVFGAIGVGKTQLVREVAQKAIRDAIHAGDTAFRPILYLDLNRYGQKIESPADLAAILTGRADEVKPTLTGSSVIDLKLPRPRAADGSGQVVDVLQQIVELMDQTNVVVIFDHLPQPIGNVWTAFLGRCANLVRSAVVAVMDAPNQTLVQNPANSVNVLPLTHDETADFLQALGASGVSADDAFNETAGVPARLMTFIGGVDSTADLTMTITESSPPDRDLLLRISQLSNGINSALAQEFVPGWGEGNVPMLVRGGLLLTETRFALGQEWFRVPGMIQRALRASCAEALERAGEEVAAAFVDVVGGGDDPQEVLVALADRPGGLQFINDMQTLLITRGTEESLRQAQGLHALLHQHLFKRGRWWDAYQMAKRMLTAIPYSETEPSEWIQLAKTQQILGLGSEACDTLEKVQAGELTPAQRAAVIDLQIGLSKDAGEVDRASELAAMYDEALKLLDGDTVSDEADVRSQRATILYNRGIFMQHWRRDLEGAVRDLEAASDEYRKLGDTNMEALSYVSWADVEISSSVANRDWNAILGRLATGIRLLDRDSAAGDLAFAHYQLARFYRRKPALGDNERAANARKARDAYQAAARWAAAAGDSRQEAIADAHVVEVSWKMLSDISADDAMKQLIPSIETLRTFRGQAWPARVARDMLALLYDIQSRQQMPEATTTIESAWNAATQPPLHPDRGTDARRAARIFALYLTHIDTTVAADLLAVNAKPLIEAWLQYSIDPSSRSEWLPKLQEFGKGAGEYDG